MAGDLYRVFDLPLGSSTLTLFPQLPNHTKALLKREVEDIAGKDCITPRLNGYQQ
jgi:hypothetical protein